MYSLAYSNQAHTNYYGGDNEHRPPRWKPVTMTSAKDSSSNLLKDSPWRVLPPGEEETRRIEWYWNFDNSVAAGENSKGNGDYLDTWLGLAAAGLLTNLIEADAANSIPAIPVFGEYYNPIPPFPSNPGDPYAGYTGDFRGEKLISTDGNIYLNLNFRLTVEQVD